MKSKLKGLIILGALAGALVGCAPLEDYQLELREDFKGLTGTMQSYDEESNIIDRVHGDSIAFSANNAFVQGDSTSKSEVLDVTIGGKQMIHVGSTLLFYEDGVENVFDEYAKTVDIENHDRAIPIVNQMVNTFQNKFIGQSAVILIRSQSGKPLATFTGNNVNVYAMPDGAKMTKILIDGKRLYIYRADYSIYETELLLNNKTE